MNDLTPTAHDQAHRDARAKKPSDEPVRLSPVSWFFARRLKVQFLIVAVALFLVYALLTLVLTFTGVREARAPGFQHIACDPEAGTFEQRVRCKIQLEDAHLAAQEAARSEEREWAARYNAEQQAITKERSRQRGLVIKRELDEHLAAIAAGSYQPTRRENDGWHLKNELLVQLITYLQSTSHPMNRVGVQVTPENVRTTLISKMAYEWPEEASNDVLRRVNKLCLVTLTRENAPPCAAAITEASPMVSLVAASLWIESFAYGAARLSASSATASRK